MRHQLVACLYGDPDCLTAALLERWWQEVEAWAGQLMLPPNEICASFREKPRGLVGGQSYGLARYRRRFAEQLTLGNIEGLDLMCFRPDGRYKALDWDFYGMYGLDPFSGSALACGIDLGRLSDVPGLSPLGFTQEAWRRARPYLQVRYGFAVVMPERFMPGGYAIGVASGEMPEDLLYDANAWAHYRNGEHGGRECDHTLRNVYGYNILNANHLQIDAGGQRLADWVGSDRGRGRIEPQGGGLFCWTFQEGDDQESFLRWDYPPVVRVREELKKHRVFPWQRLLEQR